MRIAAAALCGLVLAGLAGATSAAAQGPSNYRSWISRYGNDDADCSEAAPCRSWQEGIDKTLPGGEVDAMDSGPYGAATVDKSITLDATGALGGILAFQDGLRVDAPGATVVLRRLALNGGRLADSSGGVYHGINIVDAKVVRVDETRIIGFPGTGIRLEPRTTPSKLSVTNSLIFGNGASGVAVRPATGAAGTTARVTLKDSAVTGNDGHGIYAYSTGPNRAVISAFSSLINDNGLDGARAEGSQARVYLSFNDITGNLGQGLRALAGGQILSFANNRVFENGIDGVPTGTIAPK